MKNIDYQWFFFCLFVAVRKLEKSENITAVSCASAKTESVGIDTGSESEFSDNSESDWVICHIKKLNSWIRIMKKSKIPGII